MPGRVVVARSLRHTVRFHCPDDPSAAAVAFVRAEPAMPAEPSETIDLRIARVSGSFYDFEYRGQVDPGTPGHLLERGHMVMRKLMLEETEGAAILHGGSMVVEGRRFVVLADKGSGKTTLMMKCLSQGIAVEGDEHIVVGAGAVTARPRTLRIKASSVGLVPELDAAVLASPSLNDWNGTPIYSFAPATADVDWTIATGPADILLFLEPNHGGLSSVARLDPDDAFRRLLDNAFLPSSRKGPALANLHRLARTAGAWRLRNGDLDRALWFLRQLAQV